jgi:hypothetical protein
VRLNRINLFQRLSAVLNTLDANRWSASKTQIQHALVDKYTLSSKSDEVRIQLTISAFLKIVELIRVYSGSLANRLLPGRRSSSLGTHSALL